LILEYTLILIYKSLELFYPKFKPSLESLGSLDLLGPLVLLGSLALLESLVFLRLLDFLKTIRSLDFIL
jgi:hypothetical protein